MMVHTVTVNIEVEHALLMAVWTNGTIQKKVNEKLKGVFLAFLSQLEGPFK